MVRPALRSRSIRRVKRTSPGGRQTTSYKRQAAGKPHCAECKKPLNQPRTQKGTAKSKRRPNRPYSNLCSSCMRKKILEKVQ